MDYLGGMFASNIEIDPELPTAFIDIGSYQTRCCVNSSSQQIHSFPSLLARNNFMGIGMQVVDCFYGEDCFQNPFLIWNRPIRTESSSTNLNDYEKLIHHTFYNVLRVTPEEHNTMISSLPPYSNTQTPKDQRKMNEKVCQILFETFNVPALSIVDPAITSILSTGSTTGCVLEIGNSMARAIPIYNGLPIEHCQVTLSFPSQPLHSKRISGDFVTDCFMKLLDHTKRFEISKLRNTGSIRRIYTQKMKNELSYITLNRKEINYIKKGHFSYGDLFSEINEEEKVKQINIDRFEENEDLFVEYKFEPLLESMNQHNTSLKNVPESGHVKIGCERFLAPEILFHPSIVGCDFLPGVHQLLNLAIMRCPEEMREELYGNIVLSGGSTRTKNFVERLRMELRAIIPSHVRFNIISEQQHQQRSENGGLLSSSSLEGMQILSESKIIHSFISKDYYDEVGPSIVNRLCPFVTNSVPLLNLEKMKWVQSNLLVDEDEEERYRFLRNELILREEEQQESNKSTTVISMVNESLNGIFKWLLM